jgi:acetate CoA/acetoacetate CoA-transferase alpha subunit
MSKAISLQGAVEMIPDGASLLIGGFMGCGSPHAILGELVRQRKKNLTVVANDTARPGTGVGVLIDAKAVAKAVVSHIGTNPETQRQMIAGELEVELCPQGTLAERIRAAGFGLGGGLPPPGVGTVVAEGKETVAVDGRTFLIEKPIKADFALINAHQADQFGNLVYLGTARNFNPIMAMAAETVIVEAYEIVPVGVLPPDAVATPHVLVDHLIAKGL